MTTETPNNEACRSGTGFSIDCYPGPGPERVDLVDLIKIIANNDGGSKQRSDIIAYYPAPVSG